MKKRKRYYVYIIPCHQQRILDQHLMSLSLFVSLEKIAEAISSAVSTEDKADLLSIRNSLLFFRALAKERHREVYISLKSFEFIQSNYRHFLLDNNKQHLCPQP